MIINVPNSLSLLRGFLAVILFVDEPAVRACVLLLAAITDFLDGFLARRWKQTSRFGTIIDPITDKLFVLVALGIFFAEGRLESWQLATFFFRDISLLLFTGWLLLARKFHAWTISSFLCGKITTALQFFVLLGVSLQIEVPVVLYYLMATAGAFSLAELFVLMRLRT